MNTIAGSTNTDLDKSVLVLSLKKQHYLDKYQEPMTGTYSCFGYYDAIDIHFPQKTSSLFQKNQIYRSHLFGTEWENSSNPKPADLASKTLVYLA